MKNIVTAFLLFTLAFLVGGCSFFSLDSEYCEVKTELKVPDGFSISLLKSIEYNGSLREVQFVTPTVGYMLAVSNYMGLADVFKTTDGGQNWAHLQIQGSENPGNMVFVDESTGFISHTGSRGNLFKTIDGGATWEKKSYENLNGALYHIQKDNQGNLYAMLGYKDPLLLKSTDLAESWVVINSSAQMGFTVASFSFRVYNEKIFISGDNGSLIVTDLNGTELQQLSTSLPDIWDMEIVDEQNIVMSNSRKVIKTTNGGTTWQNINDSGARLLGFTLASEGLIIYSKRVCPSDTYLSYDVIAHTSNGGDSWVDGDEVTNLTKYFTYKIPWKDNGYLLIIGNSLFHLKKDSGQ